MGKFLAGAITALGHRLSRSSGGATRAAAGGGSRRYARNDNIAHFPHPGIVMRESKDAEATANPWPERNRHFVAQLAAWLRAQALGSR